MNHSLGILSSGVKFSLQLLHFVTNFELQLQKTTKCFSYFRLQLLIMRSSKNPCARFLITFLLFEILANITFSFSLKSVLNIKNLHNIITAHFLRNRRQGFDQRLFLKMYSAFKGITLKIF